MNSIKINDVIYKKTSETVSGVKTFLKQSGKVANKQTTSKVLEEEGEREMSKSQ